MTTLKVNEIFYSLQGESLFAGRPCVFVRLTGCNLRCTYCDTRHAYEAGTTLTIPEIIDRVRSCRCSAVEITGGEPLYQENTLPLLQYLLEEGFTVLLETNGSYDIRPVPVACIKIVDIKCPSSGEQKKNDLRNLSYLAPQDQVKFVIADRTDYEFAANMLSRITTISAGNILFSAAAAQLPPRQLAEWILKDHLPVRFHLQLHKIIWGKECRK